MKSICNVKRAGSQKNHKKDARKGNNEKIIIIHFFKTFSLKKPHF